MKQDKIILTYSKSLSKQKIKINSLHELLEAKEIETKKLENEIKNFKREKVKYLNKIFLNIMKI